MVTVSTREGESDVIIDKTEVTPVTYNDFRSEVEKPFKERKKVVGRNGEEVTLRKYHLKEEERTSLAAEVMATGGIPNPLKGRVGAYWGGVEALIQLGSDKYHSLKDCRQKMEEVMSAIMKKKRNKAGKIEETNAWREFYEKSSREGASKPKNGDGRIEQNYKVLQRLPKLGNKELNPYGSKLAQFGMCIDIEYREVATGVYLPYIRLNTQWAPDELGTTIKPIYIGPPSRRKKSDGTEVEVTETVAVVTNEVYDNIKEAEVEIPMTEELVATSVVEEKGELESSGVTMTVAVDEDGNPLISLPPDDFDVQVAEFEDKPTGACPHLS
jgi:hypothetical protein